MSEKPLVMGIDYGTDSARAVIIDSRDGSEVSSSVIPFKQWSQGKYCDPAANAFRQHPRDYIESLEHVVVESLKKAPAGSSGFISGLTIDTTGSTPAPVDRTGTPLAMSPDFEDNPNGMFILWKDHTAIHEAAEINELAHSWEGEDFTLYSGGIYSSEWFWSKILHTIRTDRTVANAAYSWIEHCDWMPALLTGNQDLTRIKRSRCAAGHKAMWHAAFNGLPSKDFLERLEPGLGSFRDRLYQETHTVNQPAGTLTQAWAKRLGLPESCIVGVGAFDAHLGAVGAEIKPYILTKVIGTSTCDILVAPMEEMKAKLVHGICGQVDGSVIPGMLGMEAGQSAFGDIYAWFKQLLSWPLDLLGVKGADAQTLSDRIIPELSIEAEKRPVQMQGILAIDWMNGRRTPDANQMLKGAIAGLNLGSDAPAVFRALVESTAFGAKAIVERFASEGVPIQGVIALGGVAKKSPFVMQVLANVLDVPIEVARSEQAVALGSAMAAATASGLYPSISAAQEAMGNGFERTYTPGRDKAGKYRDLYIRYQQLGSFIEKELTP